MIIKTTKIFSLFCARHYAKPVKYHFPSLHYALTNRFLLTYILNNGPGFSNSVTFLNLYKCD